MDGMTVERNRLREAAVPMNQLAHLFAVAVLILLLVWLFHFHEGLDYYSNNPYRVFNVHPFLMVFGFIIIGGEGLMAYKTTARAERKVRKVIHAMLNLTALCLGAVGVRAVFKFHGMLNLPNMYSLHSWIGLTTICAFGLQWAFGLVAFLVGGLSEGRKRRLLPWHVCFGRTILYMAICSALTGLIEKATFLQLQHLPESRIINFIALTILIFGILVDHSVILPRFHA
ncbi:hypothetical protein MLD38_025526 [Melastoma candidum]|uniref:Uncharacterized protein n=1 Tax=Melastoma candidum TaxID=119954 RepID=A0ACB9NX84_9MYRT|nr:hypothetical protein MLD38_025526 [Melastoma candidum]